MTSRQISVASANGWLPLILITVLTVAILIISIISLLSGWLTIFQNLFYFPIILACVWYVKRGFIFSVFLACGYFVLMAIFSQDFIVLEGAMIRVLIFILVAGVITYLSLIRIRAEEALTESEEFNRGLVESIPDLVVVYGHDRKIRFANPAATPILGYPVEEMLGTDIMDYVAPHQRAEIAAASKERFSSGRGKSLEVELITKGNQQLTFMTKGVPLHFQNQPAVLVLLADISERKQAEEILKQSEERFRTIIHSMQFGVVIIDAQTHTILEANKKALDMIGATLDMVSGSVCHRFICPAESGRCPVIDLGQTVDSSERVLITMRGEKIPILKSVITTILGGKEVLIESFVDITDRKRDEEAIQESERRLTDIIDFLPDPTFAIDTEGRVIAWNSAIASLLGVGSDEIIGKGNFEHAYRMFGHRRPVLIDLVLHGDETVIKKHYPNLKKERGMLMAELEIPLLKSKRTVLWIVATPLYNTKGEITGAIESMRDITHIHDTEVQLRESEQRLTDIIDFLPDPTFAIDNEGRVIAWNLAIEDLMGVSKANMLGKGNYAYAVPLYGKAEPVLIDLVLHEDKERERKYTNLTRVGDQLIAESFARVLNGEKGEHIWGIASPLYDQNDTIVGAIESIRVVTGRKRIEDAFKEANKKLNLLSSITRHDINNQITILQGYLRLLEKKIPDPAFKNYFESIINAAQRISSMIRFTKEYENIGVNAPVWQDASSLIEIAVKDVALGQIQLVNDLSVGTEVFADPLIVKVFYNLMDNAVRYGGKITTIRFSSEEHAGVHVVVCEDDGDGVLSEEKEKIFERGFGKNTGLGLFLASEILSITGITICETGEPGKGARFEIHIPANGYRMNPVADNRNTGEP